MRSLISDEYELVINELEGAQTYAWFGGKHLSNNADFDDLVVSKKAYDEQGHSICKQKFNIYWEKHVSFLKLSLLDSQK